MGKRIKIFSQTNPSQARYLKTEGTCLRNRMPEALFNMFSSLQFMASL